MPRPFVNSKGKRRRPGTKTLQQVLKCDDELFVDFIAKCLAWDPERRLKPTAALRHPWIAGSRRVQVASPSSSGVNGSHTRLASLTTTPSVRRSAVAGDNKPRISEPSPLVARRTLTGIAASSSTAGIASQSHSSRPAQYGSTSRSIAQASLFVRAARVHRTDLYRLDAGRLLAFDKPLAARPERPIYPL